MTEVTRLANGLTVAVDSVSAAQSVSVGLYAMVGSRSEADDRGGLAHLVEHMVFKGAGGRDARAIAEAIEDVGGSLNAWTARDQTVFHARVLPADVGLALRLIADLVRSPRFDPDELEREKQVILSELGESRDAPDDLIHDHLFEAAFGDQPLARPVLGSEGSIAAIGRDDCVAWLDRQFRPERLMVVAAGRVDPGEVVALAQSLFGDLTATTAIAPPPATFIGGARHDRRKVEQAHLALALPGLASSDPAAPALALFAQAVGGGMSSRLFQQLREDRGLAYSIYGWSQGFADTGLFAVNLSTDRARAAEALRLVEAVLADAADTLTQAELDRARAQVEAGMLMSLEGPQGRADTIARSLEVFGRVLSLDEMLGDYRAVDLASARAAGRVLLGGRRALATIGDRLALAA